MTDLLDESVAAVLDRLEGIDHLLQLQVALVAAGLRVRAGSGAITRSRMQCRLDTFDYGRKACAQCRDCLFGLRARGLDLPRPDRQQSQTAS